MQERSLRMVRSKKCRRKKHYEKHHLFQMQLEEWDGELTEAMFFQCEHNMQSFVLKELKVLRDFLSEIIAEYQPEEE